MIISRTPLRISFAGGGTDLPEFYNRSMGSVLSTSIDKYIYVIVQSRFDELIVLNYSKKETVTTIHDIEHELIRESLKKTGIQKGIEITTLADIPSQGSGLGSSSSVTVGLLNALYTYQHQQVSTERLAREACEIELDVCQKPIGKQDQYIAAYGGMKIFQFFGTGRKRVEIHPVIMDKRSQDIFQQYLVLFYTGKTRQSSKILTEQKKKMDWKFDTLMKMREQVPQLRKILESQTLYEDVGTLLHQGWTYKKEMSEKISTQGIDYMYEKALNAGAVGGKITGAGGGGFLLLYVPLSKQPAVRQALAEYQQFPFQFELAGSIILLNTGRQ